MRPLALSVAALLLACGTDVPNPAVEGGSTGDAGDDGDGDDEGGTAAQDDDGPTPSEDTGGSGAAEGDETADPEELPPPPATGIQIVEVTVDQGVRVPVVRGGEIVGPTDRNQPLFKHRPSVLRAFYEVDPGYAARSIYAILYVEQLDGTVTSYENFMQTSEDACDQQFIYDCRYGSATGSFVWRLPAGDIQPGVRYRIEMFETSPGHEDDPSDKVPVFPTDGGLMIMGVEDSYMKMRVVLVPVDHAIGSQCADPPDLHEEFGTDYDGNPVTVADYFAQRLLAQNPVDEVEIMVHDTVSYTGDLTGSDLLWALQELRFQENAPPEYFYYAVARPCDGGPDFSGVAQLGGPSPGEEGQRVGWGVYHGNVGTTAETFVHEIGHEQGRAHIRCSGEEAGADSSYPDHPEGDTESWGIDVMSMPVTINPPSSHDYMTYCGSTWVSEWGWSKVLPWIQTMSSWELNGAAGGPATKQTLLHGRVAADGTTDWFVADGWFDPTLASPEHTLRISDATGALVDAPAMWREFERTEDWSVVAPIPADTLAAWNGIEGLTLVTPDRTIAIDKASVAVVGSAATRLQAP